MMPEGKIKFEVDAWIDRKWVISDAVALELFAQYRGSSDYPFDGVSAAGIVDDDEGLLNDIADAVAGLPAEGSRDRRSELDALKGWVRNWQANHTDVTGYRRDVLNGYIAVTRQQMNILPEERKRRI